MRRDAPMAGPGPAPRGWPSPAPGRRTSSGPVSPRDPSSASLPPASRTAGLRRRIRGRLGPAQGQRDAQAGPHPDGALDGDPPAVLLDDAVADAEAQPRPLPDRLRGEEGVEDLRDRVGRDAAAVVLDLHHDLVTDPTGRDPDPS